MVVMKVGVVKGSVSIRGSQCVVSDLLPVSGLHSGGLQNRHVHQIITFTWALILFLFLTELHCFKILIPYIFSYL